LAAAQWLQVSLRDWSDLAPEGLHLVAVEPLGARQQLGGIGEVARTELVHVDRQLGPLPRERAGGSGVIEVDVGEQQRAGSLVPRTPCVKRPASSIIRSKAVAVSTSSSVARIAAAERAFPARVPPTPPTSS